MHSGTWPVRGARADVIVERERRVLGDDPDLFGARVAEVAQHEIDDFWKEVRRALDEKRIPNDL